MTVPHHIATLLYCFNRHDEILLLQRAKQPNLGLWSPCGGKLQTGAGESPYGCACREAFEEMGVRLDPRDLHLTGIVSEQSYQHDAHWLMFLFEVKRPLTCLPTAHPEGIFRFFPRGDLDLLKLPETDRERIWPLFWQHRGGFFAAHCRTRPGKGNEWTVEASQVPIRTADLPGAANFSSIERKRSFPSPD